jgi:hypothetical protein
LEVKNVAAYEFQAMNLISHVYYDIWGSDPLTLYPIDNALRLALELLAKLLDVAINHLLIDVETPTGRIQVEKTPPYLALG